MEQQVYEPINRTPRQEGVDLAAKQPAQVINSQLYPPSPELAQWERYRAAAQAEVGYIQEQVGVETKQEAAARTALDGIQHAMHRGIHRRQESFGEVALDETRTGIRRIVGRIATWISNGRQRVSTRPAQHFGSLADIGLAEPLTAAEATNYYTPEELAAMQQEVAATHKRGTIYHSQYSGINPPA